MSNVVLSRLERSYMALESSFGVVPSFGNTNNVRFIKQDLRNMIETLIRRDKTGTRTQTVGIRGKSHATWNWNGSLAPSGTAGTAPDFEPLMQCIFGQAPTVSGGTRTYNFVDLPILTMSLASYRRPSTVNQRIAAGCVVNEVTFQIGENIAEFTASGEARFLIESDYFADADTEEAGGLVSFPTEPSAPTTNGGIIAGFTGSATVAGYSAGAIQLRKATIKVAPGNETIKDQFGFYLPTVTAGNWRVVTVTADLYENDDASQQALRVAAITKAPINMTFVLGTVAGSIVTFELTNVQLGTDFTDDSGLLFAMQIPESRAFGTSTTSLNELVMTLT